MCRDESFPKKHRIKLKRDFLRLRTVGKSVSNGYLVLVYTGNDFDYCRIATIVKKSFGKAYLRNRFRRFVREVFRKNKRHIEEGYDLLVIPRKRLAEIFKEIGFHEFEECFIDLLKKAEIWSKN